MKSSRIALRKLAPPYADEDERGSDSVDPTRGIHGGKDGIFAIFAVWWVNKSRVKLRDYEGFSPRRV